MRQTDRQTDRHVALAQLIAIKAVQTVLLNSASLVHTAHARTGTGPKKIRDRSGSAVDRPGPEPETGPVRTLLATAGIFSRSPRGPFVPIHGSEESSRECHRRRGWSLDTMWVGGRYDGSRCRQQQGQQTILRTAS